MSSSEFKLDSSPKDESRTVRRARTRERDRKFKDLEKANNKLRLEAQKQAEVNAGIQKALDKFGTLAAAFHGYSADDIKAAVSRTKTGPSSSGNAVPQLVDHLLGFDPTILAKLQSGTFISLERFNGAVSARSAANSLDDEDEVANLGEYTLVSSSKKESQSVAITSAGALAQLHIHLMCSYAHHSPTALTPSEHLAVTQQAIAFSFHLMTMYRSLGLTAAVQYENSTRKPLAASELVSGTAFLSTPALALERAKEVALRSTSSTTDRQDSNKRQRGDTEPYRQSSSEYKPSIAPRSQGESVCKAYNSPRGCSNGPNCRSGAHRCLAVKLSGPGHCKESHSLTASAKCRDALTKIGRTLPN